MALFTIKPSRGTVMFFFVVVTALFLRYGWRKREERLVVRDAPHTQTTRRLLRCVLGRDAMRLLESQLVRSDPHGWDRRVTGRLQRIIAVHFDPTWPSRCIPIAEEIARRLESTREAHQALYSAREVVRLLSDAARGPLSAIEHVEDGSLPVQLANLAYEVSTMSDGAQMGWKSDLAPAHTDLFPVRDFEIPQPVLLPSEAEYVTPAGPDLLLYQSAHDRRVHGAMFGAAGGMQTDRPLGYGAPLTGRVREDVTLVARDNGDALLITHRETTEIVALPEALRSGAEALGDWTATVTPGYLWLLTHDGGVLRVRNMPRVAGARWSDLLTSVGDLDGFAGGTLGADLLVSDAVWILGVRRLATGVVIERWPISVAAPLPRVDLRKFRRRSRSRHRRGNTRTHASVPKGETLVAEWPAFDPHVTHCASGSARYLLVTSDDQISVVAVRDHSAKRIELLYAAWGAPTGERLDLSCNDHAALVFADLANQPGALMYFSFDTGRAYKLVPPQYGNGNGVRTVGGALTDHFGVIAVVDHGTTVRSYRLPQIDNGSLGWEGGTLLAMSRSSDNRAEDTDDTLGVTTVVARGDQVALIADVRMRSPSSDWHFIGRLASHDGGAHWR